MKWLLPEFIQDMLPEEAWRIEGMRREVLELMRRSGYQLVAPPLVEYSDSLLINDSADMDLRTFKLVDQLSGRTLALRADITPQVARIDAHLLNRQGVTRLCYAGNVVHTQPSGLMRTREPLQIGAELYGHGGIESDLEIQALMLQCLALLGIRQVHLDLGHVGLFHALLADTTDVGTDLERALFVALQQKDVPTLRGLVQGLPDAARRAILVLPSLYGDCDDVLQRAKVELPQTFSVQSALEDLGRAVRTLRGQVASIGLDLAELRGYHYHSGMVFAAYHAGSHDAIAVGGRYDDLGRVFGRARPATGFSMDLRQLHGLLPQQNLSKTIHAPYRQDAELEAVIAELRGQGEIVVVDLLGDAALHAELNCDRELIQQDGKWVVAEMKN
jgi:ATP phosphoribosyltransferase regulatory subunit